MHCRRDEGGAPVCGGFGALVAVEPWGSGSYDGTSLLEQAAKGADESRSTPATTAARRLEIPRDMGAL